MANYDIAIVGMGGVFPEANNIEEYWNNIVSGEQFIQEMDTKLWHMDQFYSKEQKNHKSCTTKGCFIKDFEFDALKYSLPPKSFEGVDNAQMVAIEATRQALEDAGIKPRSKELENAITVIGGSGVDEYAHVSLYLNRLKFYRKFAPKLKEQGLSDKEIETMFAEFSETLQKRGHKWHPSISAIGAVMSSVSNRVAQVFGIKNYNMTADGACASSFVSISIACHALMAGDAKVAIAGGVDLGVNPAIYIGFSRLGGLSKIGNSNPFDKDADGLIIGEGGGIVILKRLEDAIKDKDKIHSVIRGLGASSDGAGQAIYNPSVLQRSIAMKKALDVSGIDHKQIQYLEAHATSTIVGDANEYDAISTVYSDRSVSDPLYIGTVKHQIGHLKAAAGVAGLIKTVLAMKYGKIPHMPQFKELTKLAEKKADSIVIPNKLMDWKAKENGSKYAAITTSGFGGVNFHMIVEEAPTYEIPTREIVERDIAIVAIANRFPGADTVDKFWQNTMSGKEMFEPVDVKKMGWEDNYKTNVGNEQIITPKIALLDDFKINNLKYKISPRSESQMSPTQILSVEMADRLLMAYDLDFKANKNIGISIGAIHDDNYSTISFPLNADEYAESIRQTKSYAKLNKDNKLTDVLSKFVDDMVEEGPPHTEATLPGWMSNINAGIVANRLNCNGPNYTVDTACSSGLAALLPAMYQLMFTDVDMMISGGLNRHTTNVFVSAVTALGAISETKAAPFDKTGKGFFVGEGGALFLLKRLKDAKKDGDKIIAIINNIGGSSEFASKTMVAPSEIALKHAIHHSLQNTHIKPEDIGVVDTHGSANSVSDIVEANSIASEFRPDSNVPPIHITAIKSHIGHSFGGSGAAGLISVIKTLETRTVPGIRNLNTYRPEIEDALNRAKPQKENQQLEDRFKSGAVTSLGLGGANYVAIISVPEDKSSPKPVKTKSESQSQRISNDANIFICKANNNSELIAKIKEQLQSNRVSFDNKQENNICLTVSYENKEVLQQKLNNTLAFLEKNISLKPLEVQGIYYNDNLTDTDAKLAFCFPGQGTHYITMGLSLYKSNPVFKEIIDKVHVLAQHKFNLDLKGCIYGDIDEAEALERLSSIEGAQISLFAISLATASVLKSKGVVPDVMIGHSFGEVVALTFGGAWDIETAFRVVSARIEAAKLISSKSNLKMLSIVCDKKQKDALMNLAGDEIVLSNINAPGQYILSGQEAAILKVFDIAEKFGIEAKVLLISSAFHSRFMKDAVAPFKAALEKLPCSPLEIPILSTITGQYLDYSNSEELADILSKQLVTQLNLPREINTLYQDNVRYFLEVGPRWSLSKMIEAILKNKTFNAVPTLHPKVGDKEMFNRAIAFLNSINRINVSNKNIRSVDIESDFAMYLKRYEPSVIELLNEARKRYLQLGSSVSYKNQTTISAVHEKIEEVKHIEEKPIVAKSITSTIAKVAKEDISVWISRARESLSKSTGYPEDMLGEDLDLEADLGIDSVQRAEIWGTIVNQYGLDAEARPAKIKTLTELATELHKISEPTVVESTTVEVKQKASTAGGKAVKEDLSVWISRARKSLSESTGYPEDMLGEDLDLEADLGIDSVQRAEIWGSIVNQFGLDAEARPAKIKTLTELATELQSISEPTVAEVSNVVKSVQQEILTTESLVEKENISVWISRARKSLATATGYPEDMLGEDLDLEADLGIDSVQRAEIWGAIVKEYELDPEARPTQIKTLTELATELQNISLPVVTKTVVTEKVIEQETEKVESVNSQEDLVVWISRARNSLAKATGYPEDMLGEDLDLEADLGIDSVQRAEIWGGIIKQFDLDPEARPTQIKTLTQLATELLKISLPAQNKTAVKVSEIKSAEIVTITDEKPIDDTNVNQLFYSGYCKVEADKITEFDSKKILVLVASKNDVKNWSKYFESVNKQAEVFIANKFAELNDTEILRIGTSVDTIIILSHSGLFKVKAKGTALAAKILEETHNLYNVFKILADSLRKNPVRIICPIKQDGAFGAGKIEFQQQGSFPAGFIRSLQHEFSNCNFQLIDCGNYEWKNVVSKIIDINLPYHEVGLLNNEWVYPVLMKTTPNHSVINPVGKDELVLVTGGARGIVYECVVDFAKATNCKLLLTGRTELPDNKAEWLKVDKKDLDKEMMKIEVSLVKQDGLKLGDAKRITSKYKTQFELSKNLDKLKELNIEYVYKVCDVQDEKVFSNLIKETIKTEKIRGVIHGAGVQKSKLLEDLSEQEINLTLKTKLNPLFIIAENIDFSDLRLLFGFGSIAGLFGNFGQSDYALGNDILACAISSIGQKHNLFAKTIEWTAWTGTGMVSTEEAKRFKDSGLVPLTVEKGVKLFMNGILGSDLPRLSAFNEGAMFTEGRQLSKNYFPTRPKTTLTHENGKTANFALLSDIYIKQHLVQYNPVVPGTFTTEVFLEALADDKRILENVTFKRPLWVRDNELDIEIVEHDDKMMIVPKDRPKLTGKALETLSYATCNLKEATKINEKETLNFTSGIKNSLIKRDKESNAAFYTKLDNQFSHILKSGPIFRGVKSTVETNGIFYGLIHLTDEAVKMFEISGKFKINPVVADMAIQVAAAWGIERIDVMAIPFGIGKLNVFNQSTAREAIVICKEYKITKTESKMDVVVRELNGKLIFTMDEVILKSIPASA